MADVLTDQQGANQHAALFIPMPNSDKPDRSGGIAAGLKAREKSEKAIPAALSLMDIRAGDEESISIDTVNG